MIRQSKGGRGLREKPSDMPQVGKNPIHFKCDQTNLIRCKKLQRCATEVLTCKRACVLAGVIDTSGRSEISWGWNSYCRQLVKDQIPVLLSSLET